MGEIEVKTPEFTRQISVQYEEFDVAAFFDDIMPYVRTPHRLYRQVDEKTTELLLGVSHPVLMKVTFDDKKKMEDFIKKLRAYGFRRGDWKWI